MPPLSNLNTTPLDYWARIQATRILQGEFGELARDVFQEPALAFTEDNDKDLEELLKLGHLNREQRKKYHKLNPDVEVGSKGEVYRNACSLELSDIITKYK